MKNVHVCYNLKISYQYTFMFEKCFSFVTVKVVFQWLLFSLGHCYKVCKEIAIPLDEICKKAAHVEAVYASHDL